MVGLPHERGDSMSTYEALSLMLAFGVLVAIIVSDKK